MNRAIARQVASMNFLTGSALFLFSGMAQAQMYECRSATGSIYQQNAPCPPGTDTRARTPEEQRRRARREKEAAERNENEFAAMRNQVRLGMTKDQVLRAWGYPARTATDMSKSAISESWIYRCGPKSPRTVSVRFREEKASNIHWGC